ncbi:hypothetical protein KIH39_18805 [Telmatocola sphagniphila]|uniref:Tetratricopeptide repeat protein n=2 Tax=Telmatocola sphagniphila TaxID=1123043 RepID=A0A8E6EVH2_9BACT|nr:hypothetical protein KIH39_18805 [Telmatocola sphagniphila]
MAQLQALLAEDPKDSFLRYGLALEYSSSGDDVTAANKLKELLAEDEYVPGFLMAGQILHRLDRDAEAVELLRKGIEAARRQGNAHAAGEMEGLLVTLE